MSNMTQLVMAEVARNTQTCYCPSSNALMACLVRGGGEDWGGGCEREKAAGKEPREAGRSPSKERGHASP